MNKKTLLMIASVVAITTTLTACNQATKQKETEVPTPQKEVSETTKNTTENPTAVADGKAESVDQEFFKQFKTANEQSESIWSGYDFKSYPKYVVYREEPGVNSTRGFVIDPANAVPNSAKIPDGQNQGINVYRYDGLTKEASKTLAEGNDSYDFDFTVNKANDYYLQAYDPTEVDRSVGSSAIETAFHEVFHTFQTNTWTLVPGAIQDEEKYPINDQLLPLQLMTLAISKKFPAETDTDNIKKYLSMYVAIRSKEMELDPTPNKMVKNMANPQEQGEGTAKYVEYEIGKRLFNDFDETYEVMDTKDMATKSEVREYFAWGIWYYTGAGVVDMLKKLGIDVENQVKDGKTLYDIASETLNLTDEQKETFLEQAKSEFNYDTTIMTEANRLLGLK